MAILSVLGRTFQAHVNDRPNDAETFTVIGVLAPGHWHMNVFTEVLAPLRAPSYPYLVRVREGVPPATAADRIAALVRAGARGCQPAGVWSFGRPMTPMCSRSGRCSWPWPRRRGSSC